MSMTVLMPDIMKAEHNVRVLQEAKSLQDGGHEVKVIGFSNITQRRRFTVNGIQIVSFYLHDGRSGIGKIYRYLTAIKMLIGVNLCVLLSKADVYHAHNFHVLPACFLSSFIHRGKLIYDSHEAWTIHKSQKYHPERICAFVIEQLFLRFADAFITVNEMVVDYYEQKYRIEGATILYNTRPQTPLRNEDLIRKKLHIDENKKIAVFVGGFWPSGRGIFELIQSGQYLDEEIVIVLMGYGSSDMLKRMHDEIRRVKGENSVFILPPQPADKVMQYVMSADIGMNLIKCESRAQDFQSPWKVFEYCMGGLAVISTDLPFHRKVHEKYDIGVLVGKDNDPEEIAQKINSLVRDNRKLAVYKLNAHLAAEQEFNWERQEVKLLRVYDSLRISTNGTK